ncbi:hypothetical protein Taro_014318 [Colocasia esculenta]|uniref:Uncharacterized protein n=1 Tax=Colocasia esculenta TaxID=4460 RepID=A0A843UJ20_COLES|nr:hypothetical protein [Colocasia esculenta]
MNLELARVVGRSSWWLRSCGTTTRSHSSSPSCLLRPAQTTLLKLTKGQHIERYRRFMNIAPVSKHGKS